MVLGSVCAKAMKQYTHFLFTISDESAFSSEIRNSFPDTVFIDDLEWASKDPPGKLSIADCKSKFVYIWDRNIYPTLPSAPLPNGKYRGPQSGLVIQFIRSQLKESNILVSGTISIAVTGDTQEGKKMLAFAKGVWKILKKLTPRSLVQMDPEKRTVMFSRKDILLGNGAANWCLESEDRFLKFNNNIHIYLRPS